MLTVKLHKLLALQKPSYFEELIIFTSKLIKFNCVIMMRRKGQKMVAILSVKSKY